jgi:hypothetical protein
MRVNNRVTPAGNHEATSRNRTPADGGRNRVRGEHQPTPNRSRASTGGPSHDGYSSRGGGGGSSGGSSSHGGDRRAGGRGDGGARGHANSHATGNTQTTTTMPATGSMISSALRRLPKSTTATTSPHILHDFVICCFLRNSNLSRSPSTTQNKTQFSGSGAMPCPSKRTRLTSGTS